MIDNLHNYTIDDFKSKSDLANAINDTKGRVQILDSKEGGFYHIRIVNYVRYSGDRRRVKAVGAYKDMKTEDRPWETETTEAWVIL